MLIRARTRVYATVASQDPPDPPDPQPGNYGAGASGAAVPVPSNAVPVTPSTLANQINTLPSGTNFELTGGPYLNTYPNKGGNGYFGNPANHLSVIFDGGVTYPSLAAGTAPNGGLFVPFTVMAGNTFANFTVQKFRGSSGNQAAPLDAAGVSNVLFQNILTRDNYRSGIRLANNNNNGRYITSIYNGRWAISGGGGTGSTFWNCDLSRCGDDSVVARGITPRHNTSDRGIGKFTLTTRFRVRQSYIHDAGLAGLWWDIDNVEAGCYDNLFERVNSRAARFELSHGGEMTGNIFRDDTGGGNNNIWQEAALLIATGGPTLIENNTFDGVRIGVFFYQNDRDNQGDHAGQPEVWSPLCGSIIRNNTFTDILRYPIGLLSPYTKQGCNFVNNPGSITIQNNTESWSAGSPQLFYAAGNQTPAQWAARGYS